MPGGHRRREAPFAAGEGGALAAGVSRLGSAGRRSCARGSPCQRRRRVGFAKPREAVLLATAVLARSASRCLEALRDASEGAPRSCDETRARTGCQLLRETAKTKLCSTKMATSGSGFVRRFCDVYGRQATLRNAPRTDSSAEDG